MSAETVGLNRPWARRAVAVVLVLVLVAPLFAWAAGAVGYSEPLENAAEETGAAEEERVTNPGLMPDYGVPGVGPYVGTLVSALVGTAITLAVALAVGRALNR